MPYRIATENRERTAVAGEDSPWIPAGVEHAFKLGDSRSLCGLSLGSLKLFADYIFLPERNPEFLCTRCASLVAH
jgi:hypothetical protein